MPEFVTVYSTHTGRPHRVPEHYLDNPHLMKPFRRTPKSGASVSEEPSQEWSISALRAEAIKRRVDLTGASRSKSEILARLAAAQHPTTVDPVAAFQDPETSSDTGSDDNSPAEG